MADLQVSSGEPLNDRLTGGLADTLLERSDPSRVLALFGRFPCRRQF